MHRLTRYLRISAFCILLIGVSFGRLVQAEEAPQEEAKTALRVQPSMDQIVASPGEILTREVRVTNLSTLKSGIVRVPSVSRLDRKALMT